MFQLDVDAVVIPGAFSQNVCKFTGQLHENDVTSYVHVVCVCFRLSVKKDAGEASSSSSGSTGGRVGVAPGGGVADGGSSSTQSSSETKDVTAEVLINVVPSR